MAHNTIDFSIKARMAMQEAVGQLFPLGGGGASCFVCKLPAAGDGGAAMVGERLCILTTNSALPSAAVARTAIVRFTDRNDDTTEVSLDPATVFVTDCSLDFTFVAIKDPNAENLMNSGYDSFGYDDFGLDALEPAVLRSRSVAAGDAIYIVHQPSKGEKRDAIPRVKSVNPVSSKIYYDLNGDAGSDGSPVFDTSGAVVALHCAKGTAVLMSAILKRHGELLLEREREPLQAPPSGKKTHNGLPCAPGLYSYKSILSDPNDLGWDNFGGFGTEPWRVLVKWNGMEYRLQAAGNHTKTNINTAWTGRIVARHKERGLHRIAYDDGTCEIVHLGVISYETLSGGPPAVFASKKDGPSPVPPSTKGFSFGIPEAPGLFQESDFGDSIGLTGWEDLRSLEWRILVKWTGEEQRLQAGGGYKKTGGDTVGLAWTGRVVAKHSTEGLSLGSAGGAVHRIAYDDGAVEIADLSVIKYQTLSGGPPTPQPPSAAAPVYSPLDIDSETEREREKEGPKMHKGLPCTPGLYSESEVVRGGWVDLTASCEWRVLIKWTGMEVSTFHPTHSPPFPNVPFVFLRT